MEAEMKLFKYQNGIKLKRKNKRIMLLNSEKHPDSTFLQIQTYEKGDGHFCKIWNKRGVNTMIARLSEETLELLAQMIIQHLSDKRRLKD